MTIGERIRERRKLLNMSVDDLAHKLNKNRATIYRYENDEIENLPITIIEPLSSALDTTPAYLMGWSEESDSFGKEHASLLGDPASGNYISEIEIEGDSEEEILDGFNALAFYSKREPDGLFFPDGTKVTINGVEVSLQSYFLTDDERTHIDRYRSLDDKGKHTVDTVLEMEYNRCNQKLHLIPNAAHERTDIQATEEMKEHDDAFFDED